MRNDTPYAPHEPPGSAHVLKAQKPIFGDINPDTVDHVHIKEYYIDRQLVETTSDP